MTVRCDSNYAEITRASAAEREREKQGRRIEARGHYKTYAR